MVCRECSGVLLDKSNFCGKTTGILLVVGKVTASTELHSMCNIFEKSTTVFCIPGSAITKDHGEDTRVLPNNVNYAISKSVLYINCVNIKLLNYEFKINKAIEESRLCPRRTTQNCQFLLSRKM